MKRIIFSIIILFPFISEAQKLPMTGQGNAGQAVKYNQMYYLAGGVALPILSTPPTKYSVDANGDTIRPLYIDSTTSILMVYKNNGYFPISSSIDSTYWASIGYIASNYIALTEKGAANGVATLEMDGKISSEQVPDYLLGSVNYQGSYSVVDDTPTIDSADTFNKGWYYTVVDSGVAAINGITYDVGDWIISDGNTWGKVDNNHAVNSVNGKKGTVVLTTDDISDVGHTNKWNLPSNLGNSTTSTTVSITNSNGTGTTISGADASHAGVLTAAKSKLLDSLNKYYQGYTAFITPNLFSSQGLSDAAKIQKAIDSCLKTTGYVFIPKYNKDRDSSIWLIDSAILLKSNLTVTLDGAHLKLTDNSRDNIFRSANTGYGITTFDTLYNIQLLFKNGSILEGADNPRASGDPGKTLSTRSDSSFTSFPSESYGSDAGVSGQTQTGDWRNYGILMGYVTGFTIEGDCLIKNMHGYSISLERCKNGNMSGFNFECPQFRRINGSYKDMKNVDGVDLRNGCKDINMYRINGFTGDDHIALNTTDGSSPAGTYGYTLVTGSTYYPTDDIENVTVKDMYGFSYNNLIHLHCTGAATIKDVTIDNVIAKDVYGSLSNPNISTRNMLSAIVVGSYISTVPNSITTIKNITIKNVKSYGKEAIRVIGGWSNSLASDIYKEGDSTTNNPVIYYEAGSLAGKNIYYTNLFKERDSTDLISAGSLTLNTSNTPLTGNLLDVGGVKQINSVITPVAGINTTSNAIQAFQMQNNSTGTSAEMRFLAARNDSSYLAFTAPSSTNNGNFFGINKNTSGFIFTQGGPSSTGLALVLGTLQNKSLIFGTNNTERGRFDSTGIFNALYGANITGKAVISDTVVAGKLRVANLSSGYAKASSTGVISSVGTIPYSDISGTSGLATQGWVDSNYIKNITLLPDTANVSANFDVSISGNQTAGYVEFMNTGIAISDFSIDLVYQQPYSVNSIPVLTGNQGGVVPYVYDASAGMCTLHLDACPIGTVFRIYYHIQGY